MNWLLIWTFIAVCVVLIISGLTRRGGVYQFPFLAGATFLGFVAPQLPALADDRFLPAGGLARTLVMGILCALGCGAGWIAGSRPIRSLMRWTLDEQRLLWAAAAFSLIGALFFLRISRLPEEVRLATQPSGTIVVYLFFAKMIVYGFVLAVLCFAFRPSKFAAAIVLFDAVLMLDRVVHTAKKGELSEFALALLLAAWFQRGLVAPRIVMVAAVLFASLALNSTGAYREIARSSTGLTWSALTQIDVVRNFETVVQEGGPEVRNAVVYINLVDESHDFDFGAFHWNTIVYNFVPAQIVGRGIKDALTIEVQEPFDRNYSPASGSTATGLTDAFASFWYFGALKFFLIAYLLARIYRSAMAGWALPQIIYILTITPAMHAVTHHTQWVISTWLNMAIILVPVLLFCCRTHEGLPGEIGHFKQRPPDGRWRGEMG